MGLGRTVDGGREGQSVCVCVCVCVYVCARHVQGARELGVMEVGGGGDWRLTGGQNQ